MFLHPNLELIPHETDSCLKLETWRHRSSSVLLLLPQHSQDVFVLSWLSEVYTYYSHWCICDEVELLYMCWITYSARDIISWYFIAIANAFLCVCLCGFRTSVRTSQTMWSRFMPCWRQSSPWNSCPTRLTSSLTSGEFSQDKIRLTFTFKHWFWFCGFIDTVFLSNYGSMKLPWDFCRK